MCKSNMRLASKETAGLFGISKISRMSQLPSWAQSAEGQLVEGAHQSSELGAHQTSRDAGSASPTVPRSV